MTTDSIGVLNEGLQGTYLLERPIGEGGMATVYLAQDLKHQRPVALKVLKPELAQSLGPDRFRREITTAARLQHPHILSVHDSGETKGQFWFTMPFVEGESLRDRLKREKRLPIDEALRIAREAAQALQYAHDRGIVHRDIKPENLLLTKDGFTLVADFGIARAMRTDGGTDTTGENLTQTGASIGTPTYMAPEQATGDRHIDARVDQYSLAATLYEMLAGEPPFVAETAAALIAKRFSSPTPSVRVKCPDVPPLVDQALQQGLALRANDRFATIQEFSRAVTLTSTTPSSASMAALPTLASPSGSVPAIPAPKRLPPAVVGVGLVVLLGIGALLFRRGTANPPTGATTGTPAAPVAAGPTRLVVLPFENLGDTADAYFADGVSDELRVKLTNVPNLEVIARASSVQYRGAGRSQQEIAKELGVRYLLTGTVRWEKSGGGKGRVRVSPELIEVSPSGAPASKWQQTFDAPITDVFQVQSDIAGKVASALDVALGAGEQQKLAEQPTQNLEAYQAFLQGEALTQNLSINDAVTARSAVRFYEQAVAVDSTFALAWSHLARLRSYMYFNGLPTPELERSARAAAERALRLAPDQAEAHLAMGEVMLNAGHDPTHASAEFAKVLQRDPRNVEALNSMSAAEQTLGNWESSLAHLQQSQSIDPRNKDTARRVARALLWTRRYEEAMTAVDRAITLAPSNPQLVQTKAMIHLARGDLDGAQGVIRNLPPGLTTIQVLAVFALYWDLYWVPDSEGQQRILTLRQDAFDDNRGSWALVMAQLHALHGAPDRARAYADTARIDLEAQLRATPSDPQNNLLHALALAYLGRNAEALADADRGLALETQDVGFSLPYYQLLHARVLTMTGARDKAIAELGRILAKPFYVSKDWLRIDPNFASLRGEPAFQKLVGGT